MTAMTSGAAPATSQTTTPPSEGAALVDLATRLRHALGSVVLGHDRTIRLVSAAVLTGSHILLHDLPGVGKTTLASGVAKAMGGQFRRIQGTPDLLPSDLTGAVIPDQASGEWRFRPGPLLGNVILVDEINRISSRTQSALLQVMAEQRISIEGHVHPLPDPYLVVATMNPGGTAGTFELTIGQLDRFDLVLSLGRVERDVERMLLRRPAGQDPVDAIAPVAAIGAWPDVRRAVDAVHIADPIVEYTLDLCESVRSVGHLSVRASMSLLRLARGLAVIDGRGYVIPDDVRALAPAALAHRLVDGSAPLDEHLVEVTELVSRVTPPALGS